MTAYRELTFEDVAKTISKLGNDLIGHNCLEIMPFDAGVSNSVYKVKTDKGTYVFKLSEEVLDPYQRNIRHEDKFQLLEIMKGKNAPIPNILSYNIKLNGKDLLILEFCKGYSSKNLNYAELEQVGKSLALFHLSSQELKKFQKSQKSFLQIAIDEVSSSLNKIASWKNVDKELKFLRGCGEYIFNKLTRDIKYYNLSNKLPYGKIHQDLNAGNFIFSNEKTIIIDYDRFNDGPFIKDLANAIFKLCIDPVGNQINKNNPKKTRFCIDENSIRSLLKGYTSIRNISKDEIYAMGYFIDLSANELLIGSLKNIASNKSNITFFRDKIRQGKALSNWDFSKYLDRPPLAQELSI